MASAEALDWNICLRDLGFLVAWWLGSQDECPQREHVEAVSPFLNQPLKDLSVVSFAFSLSEVNSYGQLTFRGRMTSLPPHDGKECQRHGRHTLKPLPHLRPLSFRKLP